MLFVTYFSCSIFSQPCVSSHGLICLLWTGHFQNTNGHIAQVRCDKTSGVFLLSLQRPVNLNLPSLSWQGRMTTHWALHLYYLFHAWSLLSADYFRRWFCCGTLTFLLNSNCPRRQVTKMRRKTSVFTSSSPSLGKWSRHRYWPDLHAFLLKLILQSYVWTFLCVSPSPAGVVQVPGPSGVGPGRAHHHLWRHQTRSRDAVSQFAQVTGELIRNLRSFHLNFLV